MSIPPRRIGIEQREEHPRGERLLLPRQEVPEHNMVHPEVIEKRKNEIVNAMLMKIKPFVGSNGALQPDADFDGLAKLMEQEHDFMSRTLLLTILLSSTADPVKGGDEAKAIVFLLCDRLTRCNAILATLYKWLTEVSKAPEPACHLSLKILQLLSRLHLTLDHLVQHKYGKLIKKILTREDVTFTDETKKKAQELFDRWSEMAHSEDNRRRSSDSTGKRSSESALAMDNPELMSEPPVAPKTRAELVLERAAKAAGQQSSGAVPTRPLSADDIHKAKKRRQYLQEAISSGQTAPEELEQLGIDIQELRNGSPPHAQEGPYPMPMDLEEPSFPYTPNDVLEEVTPTRQKKRVSFANEEDLVQVHYFEPHEEEHPRKTSLSELKAKKKFDYHHADKQEASYAFKRLQLTMEADIQWKVPLDIVVSDESIIMANGEESRERSLQEQRERQTVSAIYYSAEHIPPSPSEDEATYRTGSDLYAHPVEIGGGSQDALTIVIPNPNAMAKVDLNLLSALLGNQKAYVPPAFQGPGLPLPPNIPPVPIPQMPLPPRPHLPPLPGLAPPPLPMFPPPNLGAAPMLPPFPPVVPNAVPMRPPPFPFPLPQAPLPPRPCFPIFPGHPSSSLPPMPLHPRPNFMDRNVNPRLQTKLCKFYKSGQPGSCRFGSSCLFLHQDY